MTVIVLYLCGFLVFKTVVGFLKELTFCDFLVGECKAKKGVYKKGIWESGVFKEQICWFL